MKTTLQSRSALRALEAKATRGPWEENTEVRGWAKVISASGGICGEVYSVADATVIAAARNALPDLLDDLDEAEREIERLRSLLASLGADPK